MEAKTVIMTVLLLSLVIGQIQVESKICCPSPPTSRFYNVCVAGGGSQKECLRISGCYIVRGQCPRRWEKDILENSGDVVNEYCKLGCASSVCGAITTLQNSDASEVVNGTVERCTKVCSAFCTKGSITAVETV